MNFWAIFAMVALSIPVSSIIMDAIINIHKLRLRTMVHQENIERMRNGYPPIEDKMYGKKIKMDKVEKLLKHDEVIDLTGEQPNNGN